ncbi:MAG TPA: UDP-N-acetylmuramate dehydrogenase [Verrucomicrobiae bacterium]|jgi:UDP-N-acetylenolpyruvoylglucosamine reductase
MTMPSPIFQKIKDRLPQAIARENEPLGQRTTLRVGGQAELYVEPASEEDLSWLALTCRQEGIPLMLLGRGSNLLVRDGGLRGVVVCLAHPNFSKVEAAGSELRCGAGARLKAVTAKAREASLGGLEFLEGIPGSVGGALRMNAGAMGGATFEVVTRVRFLNDSGEVSERGAAEVPVEYRSCSFFKTNIALAATFRGRSDSKEAIAKRASEFNQKRWASQPKEPSAGCIFKNPSAAISAGKLIDELGLKGTRRGGAVVSAVHGNFIVNEGSATARDVLELIDFIKTRAKAERGVELREEVEIIGQ